MAINFRIYIFEFWANLGTMRVIYTGSQKKNYVILFSGKITLNVFSAAIAVIKMRVLTEIG